MNRVYLVRGVRPVITATETVLLIAAGVCVTGGGVRDAVRLEIAPKDANEPVEWDAVPDRLKGSFERQGWREVSVEDVTGEEPRL